MCDLFNELVYINSSSLSDKLCIDIIELFENDEDKYKGVTGKGFDETFKLTTDLNVTIKSNTDDIWKRIHDLLIKELTYNLKTYIKKFESLVNNEDYNLFQSSNLGVEIILLQRYKANTGFFKYHDDHRINWKNKSKRVLVFIWYLNDVYEGGETELCGIYKIKPTVGKLLVFPAEWTFPHRGIMPKTNDKYILTGWINSY